MNEKYDLNEMLAEINKDDEMNFNKKNVKASQDDIKKMLARKRKEKQNDTKSKIH